MYGKGRCLRYKHKSVQHHTREENNDLMSAQRTMKRIEFLPFKSLKTSRTNPRSQRTRKVIIRFNKGYLNSDKSELPTAAT